jgi:hypothetical protein
MLRRRGSVSRVHWKTHRSAQISAYARKQRGWILGSAVQSRWCSPSAVGGIGRSLGRIQGSVPGVSAKHVGNVRGSMLPRRQRKGVTHGIQASLMIAKTSFADNDLHTTHTRLGLFVCYREC